MKINELTGAALDWAVANCECVNYVHKDTDYAPNGCTYQRGTFQITGPHYSKEWSQGGPIIERERIFVKPMLTRQSWRSYVVPESGQGIRGSQYGDTPLIAAMRCYVASKLGDDIEIPKELIAE